MSSSGLQWILQSDELFFGSIPGRKQRLHYHLLPLKSDINTTQKHGGHGHWQLTAWS